MTTGEKMAYLRKGKNLSQEAFGEIMGISRQAVSKWESDASIPDVDKLIAISKEFNVSIGWILGVQEGEDEKPDALNENQIKAIEKIVEEYISKLNSGKTQKNRKLGEIAALFLAAIVILILVGMINIYYRMDSIENQQSDLRNSMNYIGSSLESQINSISSEMPQTVAESQSMLISKKAEITDVDLKNNTANIHFEAVPQNVSSEAKVTFVLTVDSTEYSLEVPNEGSLTYTADMVIDINKDMKDGEVFICFDNNGNVVSEKIDDISFDVYPKIQTTGYFGISHNAVDVVSDNGLPIRFSGSDVTINGAQKKFVIADVYINNEEEWLNDLEFKNPKVEFRVNGKVENSWNDYTYEYSDFYDGEAYIFYMDRIYVYNAKEGDNLSFVFTAEDNFGNYYETPIEEMTFNDGDISFKDIN